MFRYVTSLAEHIGRAIKTKRQALGLSQHQLASRLNVHVNTVSRWENATSIPRDLDALAAALDTTTAELIGATRA